MRVFLSPWRSWALLVSDWHFPDFSLTRAHPRTGQHVSRLVLSSPLLPVLVLSVVRLWFVVVVYKLDFYTNTYTHTHIYVVIYSRSDGTDIEMSYADQDSAIFERW